VTIGSGGSLAVESGGTLDAGTFALAVSGDVVLAGGSRFKADDVVSGGNLQATKITAKSGEVTLELAKGKFTDNDVILVATSSGDLDTTTDNLRSLFYDLDILNDSVIIKSATDNGGALAKVGAAAGIDGPTQNYTNAMALLARIAKNGPAALDAKLGEALEAIDAIESGELTEVAIKQLIGESVVNVPSAVTNLALKAQGVIYGRLDRIREANSLIPPAAGEGSGLNRVWVGGFGLFADTDNWNGIYGYEYTSGGLAIGYDRQFDGVPGLRLGVSAALSSGQLKNNDGLTSVDIKTFGIGAYGSYQLSNGLFFDATVAYGLADNDSTVRWALGGQKTGNFDISSWQFGLRTGAALVYNNIQFIPSVGARFLFFENAAWSETLTGAPVGAVANSFAKTRDSQVDIPVSLKINTTIETSSSASVVPELRLGWTYAAKRPDNVLKVGFVGTNDTANIYGVQAKRSTFQVGAGIKVKTSSLVDIYANYDLDTANGYKAHNVSLGLGFEF
jgi:outer membrane autotransporter protein